MQGEVLPLLLVSSTNTPSSPAISWLSFPQLITEDKDKERKEEGAQWTQTENVVMLSK